MYMLIVTALVDLLLPSVHIPLFAWCLLILLWVCRGAVKDAKKQCAPKVEARGKISQREIYTPELDWIVDPDDADQVALADGKWSIYNDAGKFWLFGSGKQELELTATNFGAAMDQADFIINTLTPPTKRKK